MAGALTLTSSATSTAAGAITFTINPAPQGTTLTGSMSVPMAPVGAQFTLYKGGAPIKTWAGYDSAGPFQGAGQDTLSVKGTGLAASTVYTLVWVAAPSDTSSTDALYPVASFSPAEIAVAISDIAPYVLLQAFPAGTDLLAGMTIPGSAVTSSFQAIAVVLTSVTGAPNTLLGQAENTPGAGLGFISWPNIPIVVPAQWNVVTVGGAGQNSMPFSGGVYPLQVNPGDQVKIFYLSDAGAVTAKATVYGLRYSPPLPITRSDGRPLPVGSQAASPAVLSTGTVTVIAAPAVGLGIMLASASLTCGPSAGSSLALRGTVNGVAVNVLTVVNGTDSPGQGSLVWPQGLLLDPHTALTMTLATTNAVAGANVAYDIVA